MNAATAQGELPQHEDLVDQRLVLWYFLAALAYLAISLSGGLLMALQLVQWNPLRGIELLSPGRWRMVHTNAVAYGFLANAFLGSLHWAVPRLTLRPVLSRGLSYFIFFAWQAVVVATAVGILLGYAQGVEWGETPTFVDPIALLGLLLVAMNFMAPIAKTKGPLYVSLWYFMAAFVWTFLTYAMGNFVPEYVAAGTSGGAVAGLFIHDLVGLFVTPLGWGLMYYFVPVLLRKPLWSHGLSLVGFWGLAFFYPLNGIHHFLYTPIPMFLQYGAVVATIAVEMVVTTVIVNFFGTLWGSGRQIVTNLPIRWFYTGMVFYFITCAAVRLASHVDVPDANPLHGLGRGTRASGDVRRVHALADGHHDVSLPAAAGARMVQPATVRMALLVLCGGHSGDVPRPDVRRHLSGLSLGVDAGLGRFLAGFASVLGRAAVCRVDDHRGSALLLLQHLSHLADGRRTGCGSPGAATGMRTRGRRHAEGQTTAVEACRGSRCGR